MVSNHFFAHFFLLWRSKPRSQTLRSEPKGGSPTRRAEPKGASRHEGKVKGQVKDAGHPHPTPSPLGSFSLLPVASDFYNAGR